MATLLVVLRFLRTLRLTPVAFVIAWAMVALNSAAHRNQATNDSFVILFGTLALYFGYGFFRRGWRTTRGWWLSTSSGSGISRA